MRYSLPRSSLGSNIYSVFCRVFNKKYRTSLLKCGNVFDCF
ncbi:hypothetical protein HMPREF9096_01416 [Haemophilus sp. oral taxon 851 str. F0397]|nr:hypothetical protein HMPREF9096_01416 [Haemophilus sp. oral taxon 851 str. F0397]